LGVGQRSHENGENYAHEEHSAQAKKQDRATIHNRAS